MLSWRLTIGTLLIALIGLPLALPLTRLLLAPDAWSAWSEAGRFAFLLRNTFLLLGGTLILSLPSGIIAAFLFYRTDLPGRRIFRGLVLLALFIPLPLFASAWQAILGSGGLSPTAFWNPVRSPEDTATGIPWSPWGQGVLSAIWIHALTAVPWVILLVGQGLLAVEPSLEEDGLTAASPWRVLVRISLPRARVALAGAALWVALQTTTEITVTDVMQVRTFAEELYTQLNAPDLTTDVAEGETRALAVTLPFALTVAGLVMLLVQRWDRSLPAGFHSERRSPTFSLGRWRWPAALLTLAASVLYVGLPLLALVWRAGALGHPPGWSVATLLHHLTLVARTEGAVLFGNLTAAGLAGLLTAGLALLACWAALENRALRTLVLVLMALAWAWPGPIVGLGLKAVIAGLVDGTGSPLLAGLLWHGPSILPLIWVAMIRFFPCAVALLWPALRLAPRDLIEAARVDGARSYQELLWVIAPLNRNALARATLAVAVLSLGELSASKLVSTPGQPSYAYTIFTQMHWGVTNDLAARCLLLLLVAVVGALAIAYWDD